MDSVMALGGNMGHRHQHGPQLDPDIVLSGSTDHKLQHRLRPLTSTWSLVAAWPTDGNMALGSGTDHGQLHVPRWQHGPLNIHMVLRLHNDLGQQYEPLRPGRPPGEAWTMEGGVLRGGPIHILGIPQPRSRVGGQPAGGTESVQARRHPHTCHSCCVSSSAYLPLLLIH